MMNSYFKCIPGIAACLLLLTAGELSAQRLTRFEGEKTSWHGFDRYDYLMDLETLAINPIIATIDEGTGMNDKNTPNGQVRCIVVAPKSAAEGTPAPLKRPIIIAWRIAINI